MRRSLKSALAWISVAATVVGFGAATALIALTTMLHVVAQDLSKSLESMRAAGEVRVQLLLHQESASPVLKAATRAALLNAVDEVELFVQSDEEQQGVVRLRTQVDDYLRTGEGKGERAGADAFATAQRLSTLNLARAQWAQRHALVLERNSKVAGIGVAALLLLGLAGFLVWIHRGPFRQIGELSDAMDRFRGGDLDSRAPDVSYRELGVMARTFNATAEALVRARQRQTEYIATVIHDLRTPLTAIQLALGYVAPGRPLPPEQRIRELVTLIDRQLTRLNGLVGDVLNATWIDAGELTLLRESVDLRSLTEASVDCFRALAPEHRIELTMPSQPVFVHGDRARLEQVLNNLLSNAVKYSPLGSRIRVDLVRRGDEVAVEVADEGVGIAPGDRERIFETFQRRSATHEEAPGTSLGLWVSRHVVDAHGGRIELDSRVGHGSTFRVVLPIETQPEARALEPAHPQGSGL